MSKIPQSKEEMEQILASSFEYYKSVGKDVSENYQTDYWKEQLELHKKAFVESNFDEGEWRLLLMCCKSIITYSQPIEADVFNRYLPSTEMYDKMCLLFNDGKALASIHTNKVIKIHDIMPTTFPLKLPTFEIRSATEHPNTVEKTSLFTMFGLSGQTYVIGADTAKDENQDV